MKELNNSIDGGMAGKQEGVRYPGVARMFLIWTAIGALTVARTQFSFGRSGLAREAFSGLIACSSWYFPWAILTPLVFRIERKFPLGSPGWRRHVALLAAISVPFCLAASIVMMLIFGAIRYAFGTPTGFTGGLGFWMWAFPSAEGIFWCSVAGGYFVRTLFQLHEQE